MACLSFIMTWLSLKLDSTSYAASYQSVLSGGKPQPSTSIPLRVGLWGPTNPSLQMSSGLEKTLEASSALLLAGWEAREFCTGTVTGSLLTSCSGCRHVWRSSEHWGSEVRACWIPIGRAAGLGHPAEPGPHASSPLWRVWAERHAQRWPQKHCNTACEVPNLCRSSRHSAFVEFKPSS